MAIERGKRDSRYHDHKFFDPASAEEDLPGDFWVVCPTDGVQTALRVRQWSRESSAIMRESAGDEWFMDNLYTSGNCGKCGMSLPVVTVKP